VAHEELHIQRGALWDTRERQRLHSLLRAEMRVAREKVMESLFQNCLLPSLRAHELPLPARGEVKKQVTHALPGMDARIWDAVKFTCTIGMGRARTTEVCRAVQDYLGEEVQPARIRLVST
jgi:hypothetical protein